MAKELVNGAVIGLVGNSSSAWINQINDGTTTHDITVSKGITFFNGSGDKEGITWDGVQPLQVIIPTLADIVSNPVVLKGTVGADGASPITEPSNGDLVYITANCTFAGQACEAGDMAVYYNNAWHVISGENQVSFPGTVDASGNKVVALGKTGVDVLDVEGKKLNLAIDYADLRSNISVSLNASNTLSVTAGKVAVSSKFINLSQADGTTDDITTAVSIDLPTALASGAVTIADNVLASGDFTFTSGSFPTISRNAAAITVNASHNMTVVASGTGDFVTGVTAIKAVTFENATDGDAAIAYVSGINSVPGKSFVSGIHAHAAADGDKAPDFTVAGVVTAASSSNTFVTGLEDTADSGDVVSAITVGAVTGTFVTGLSGNDTSVITGVTFGDAEQDSTRSWFVTGLADDAAAVTAVSFGTVEVTPQTSAAVVSASVNNHVLSFTTGNFMTSATAALSGTGVTTKAFTKGGVKLSGFNSTSDTLVTGSVSQATTTISYKNLTTGVVTLSQETVGYHLDKAESAAYEALMGYKKFALTSADVTKSGAALDNTAITASIPADTVAVGLNAGTLPTLTIGAPSATISGTVGTALTTASKSWLAVNPAKKEIAVPGAYSLVEVAEGGVAVAKADNYNLDSAKVTIPADQYVSDIFVDGTSVIKTVINNG